MNLILVLSSLLLATCASAHVWSYDADLARSYQALFADVNGAEAGKALHFVSPEAFISDLQNGRKIVIFIYIIS